MQNSIFKAYDIRGLYPQELTEDDAYAIGQAFVKFLRAKDVLIGEDDRPSSPALKEALVRGITETGANVILAGKLTTPMFYFAVASYNEALRLGSGPSGGIMITASHNPAKYNGFKLVQGDAMPIEPKNLLKFLAKNPKSQIPNPKKGNITKINIEEAYVKKVLSLVDVKKIKPAKIVIDAGNGMAGAIVSKLLKKIPQIKTTKLFFDIDMSFPNHEANPLNESTLADLKRVVKKEQASLGVAYDGDADRIGFVDENGTAIRADLIFSAILPQIFKRHPKTTALYDLRCSKIVSEEIKKLGGKPQMTRVGHAFIKKQLRKTKAAAAAELSSHFYFQDFYGVECSDLVMLYLLLEMSETKKPLSEIIKPFAKYFQSGEINFEVQEKDKKIAELVKKYKKSASGFSEIDGVRMEFTDKSPSASSGHQAKNAWWWMSLRASNTEPLLRLNIEASNKKLLEEKTREISKII